MRVAGWGALYEAGFYVACMALIPAAVTLGPINIGLGKQGASIVVVVLAGVAAAALLRILFGLLRLASESVLSVAFEISSWPVRILGRALFVFTMASLVLERPQWMVEASFYLGCLGVLSWSSWVLLWSRDWIVDRVAGLGRRRGVFSRRQWVANAAKDTSGDTVDSADAVFAVSVAPRDEVRRRVHGGDEAARVVDAL